MQPMIRWYVMVKDGGVVGGPYKSEGIAIQHLVSLREKFSAFNLVIEERDIHKLAVHK